MPGDLAPIRFQPPVLLRFHGERGGTAPLAWAQRYMYDQIRSLHGQERLMALVARVAVPPGSQLDTVLAALRHLVERHEALRTVIRFDARGDPVQHVVRSGVLPVQVGQLDDGRVPGKEDLRRQLRAAFADALFGGGWQLSPCLLRVGEDCHSVVVMLSHLLTDALGIRVMLDDLTALLHGAPPHPATLTQPVDLSRFERSAAGRQANREALARARAQLAMAPPAPVPVAGGWQEANRYRCGELVSVAAATAARAAAMRLGVPVAAVLLGLLGVVLGRHAGARRRLVMVVSHNRLDLALQRYPSYLVQLAPVTLTDLAGSVEAILRRTAEEMIVSCSLGRYCTLELAQLVRQVGYHRGVHLDLGTIFNYHSLRSRAADRAERADPATLAAQRGRTSFRWRDGRVVRRDCRVFVDVGVADALTLGLRIDTASVAPAAAEGIARGVERALVELVAGDLDVDRVARLAGVGGRCGTGLVEIDGGPVDLARCRAAAHAALELTGGELFVEGDGDGHPRLVAHLAPRDRGVSVEMVHRRLVDALAHHPGAMAAHRYVLHTAPPADPPSRRAWRDQPVLRAGTGRCADPGALPEACPACAG